NFLYEAKDVKDAIKKLVENENSEVISGGTDVLIRVREGKDAGMGLVSIHNIAELKGVKKDSDDSIVIGAGTSFHDITYNEIIKECIPSLGEAVDTVGGPQVRETATIGGNICNGATSADSASTMTALQADIILEGPNGERVVNIKDFYTGPGKTVRDRCEVCKCFKIKKENYENYYGYYFKYGKRKSLEIATLGCSVLVKLNASKDAIEDVKIAYGVAAPTPSRAYKAEEFAKGKKLDDKNLLDEFAELALSEMKPRDSWRASKEFREQLIKEMAKRSLVNSIRRAGGKIEYYV
ncbi:MAG: xanthine dehydrogenase FAD-binding subunit XdhB, partial [Lachnospiraceae bacterium]|nr:xanthine dehydrogenase FAD-binding subunit XdhB [Lachnospiraceae bacterium]